MSIRDLLERAYDYGYLPNLIAEVASSGLAKSLKKSLEREFGGTVRLRKLTERGNMVDILLDVHGQDQTYTLVIKRRRK